LTILPKPLKLTFKLKSIIVSVVELLLACGLSVMIISGLTYNIIGKPVLENDDTLRDIVISSRERINSQDSRLSKLDEAQSRQWAMIGALTTDVSAIHTEQLAMKETQALAMKLLYAILTAILVKTLIDMMKAKQVSDQPEGSRRKGDYK
jgi:hypothetical protein